jgi:hypothetical protein
VADGEAVKWNDAESQGEGLTEKEPERVSPNFVERDEGEQDRAEMVGEEVPTANGHERRVAIRQKPNPLLKNPQIKGLSTKKVETTKGSHERQKNPYDNPECGYCNCS